MFLLSKTNFFTWHGDSTTFQRLFLVLEISLLSSLLIAAFVLSPQTEPPLPSPFDPTAATISLTTGNGKANFFPIHINTVTLFCCHWPTSATEGNFSLFKSITEYLVWISDTNRYEEHAFEPLQWTLCLGWPYTQGSYMAHSFIELCKPLRQGKAVICEGEAWHAAVHGVTKSQTQLGGWTTTEPFGAVTSVGGRGPYVFSF